MYKRQDGYSTGNGVGQLVSDLPVQRGKPGNYHWSEGRIVHMRNFPDATYGELWGQVTLKSLLQELSADSERSSYIRSIFKSGGIRGIITPETNDEDGTPTVGAEDTAAVSSKLSKSLAAIGQGGVAWVDAIIRFIQIGSTPNDLMADTAHRLPESRTSVVTGIPAALMQLLAALESSQFRHLPTLREYEAETLLQPLLTVMERQLTAQVMPSFTARGELSCLLYTSPSPRD